MQGRIGSGNTVIVPNNDIKDLILKTYKVIFKIIINPCGTYPNKIFVFRYNYDNIENNTLHLAVAPEIPSLRKLKLNKILNLTTGEFEYYILETKLIPEHQFGCIELMQ